jgi:hypothetical protein
MDKAIKYSTDRRSFIKGASFATVAVAIPAAVATAIGATPALAEATTSIEAADPIFALIAEAERMRALLQTAGAQRGAIAAAWPLLARKFHDLDAAERAAWEVQAERSGYNRAGEHEDAVLDLRCDALNAAMLCSTTTAAGALARMALIREQADFSEEHDLHDRAILGLFDDFERLLAGSAVAA